MFNDNGTQILAELSRAGLGVRAGPGLPHLLRHRDRPLGRGRPAHSAGLRRPFLIADNEFGGSFREPAGH
jgi:hypothetical protein